MTRDEYALLLSLLHRWQARADRYAGGPKPSSWDEARAETYRRCFEELTALMPVDEKGTA